MAESGRESSHQLGPGRRPSQLRLLADSARALLIDRFPETSLTFWKERAALPDADREPLALYRSPANRRARAAMTDRRTATLGHWTQALRDAGKTDLPEITICTVLHNSAQWVERFAKGLERIDYPKDRLSLVIVDSGSEDGCADTLKTRLDAVGWTGRCTVETTENRGYGTAQNVAVSRARTDLVLLLNPDAQLLPGALRAAATFRAHDETDIAAWEFRQWPYEHPKYYDPVTLETSWNSHAAVLVERAAFEAVGGYDERLFMYGEDVELSYRLRRAGHRLRYLPWAGVVHDSSDTQASRARFAPAQIAANRLLRRRYGSWLDRAAGALLAKRSERRARADGDLQTAKVLTEAAASYARLKSDFAPSSSRESVDFPFSGFGYTRTRRGVWTASPSPRETPPLVSIVTRTQGLSPALRDALACVQHQTHAAIEHIIVVDQGGRPSEPGTPGRVEELAGEMAALRAARLAPPVETDVIAMKAGDRILAAQAGLDRARGDYVLFLDDDDLLFADHVEGLVGTLDAHPEAVAAYALSWQAQMRDRHTARADRRLGAQINMEASYAGGPLADANRFAIQSVLVRRDVLESVGGVVGDSPGTAAADAETRADPTLLEDWDMWRRCLHVGPFVAHPKTTSIYASDASLTARFRRTLSHSRAGRPLR